MNKRTTGANKEKLAAAFLERRGCRILTSNFRSRVGEIDLIVLDEADCLCFVEVKYRSSVSAGYPQEAVHFRKQYTICRVADYYRIRCRVPNEQPCRFDVVAILGEQVTWIQNAFTYLPSGG